MNAASTELWDVAQLSRTPAFEFVDRGTSLSSLYYEGEPYRGATTRVFAYHGRPAKAVEKLPAMVCIHGGQGRAYAEFVQVWTARGYAALAMDVSGQGPGGTKDPKSGPMLTEEMVFGESDLKDAWTYQAVAAVLRGTSLLASFPEVDPDRIGVTGISYGGYLCCVAAGLDDRFKFAAPVYGCGFIHENSAWLSEFAKMTPAWRQTWIDHFDPSRYLPRAKTPMLWLNGTNDFAYPLDSYQKSYRLARGPRQIGIRVDWNHGHNTGWDAIEVGLFADQHVRGGTPLPRIAAVRRNDNEVEVDFVSQPPIQNAELIATTDTKAINQRAWQTVPAHIEGHTAKAELPSGRPLTYFVNLTDSRGAVVSSEHEVLEG